MSVPQTQLAKAPYYYGELYVDSDANLLTYEVLNDRHFLAFKAPPYNFDGTIRDPESDIGLSKNEIICRNIRRIVEEKKNETLLAKALLILSQHQDGRRLLLKSHKLNFRMMFDRREIEKEEALGMLDYAQRRIPLSPSTDPYELALTCQHELQHMEDMSNGLLYDVTHTLKSGTIASRALEASARVSEAHLAFKLAYDEPGDHPRRFKTTECLSRFKRACPAMFAELMHSQNVARNGQWNEVAWAVFKAYYREIKTLAYYDRRLLKSYTKKSPAIAKKRKTDKAIPKEKFMSQSLCDHNHLTQTVTLGGNHYIPPATKNMDLANPTWSSLSRMQDIGRSISKLLRALHVAYGVQDHRIDAVFDALLASNTSNMMRRILSAVDQWRQSSNEKGVVKPSEINADPEPSKKYIYNLPSDSTEPGLLTAFASSVAGHIAYQSPIEYLRYGLENFMGTHGNGNYRAKIEPLIHAGLRAPMAAFPDQVVMGILGAVRRTAEKSEQTKKTYFSPAELSLLEHWHDLANQNIDPCTGFPAGKTMPKPGDRDIYVWAEELGSYFRPSNENASLQTFEPPNLSAIKQWMKDKSTSSDLPERGPMSIRPTDKGGAAP